MPFSSVDMPESPRQKPKVGEPKVGELSEKSNPHLIFFMFSAYWKDNVHQNNALYGLLRISTTKLLKIYK